MKRLFLLAAILNIATPLLAQRKAVFHDSLGRVTTYELHWSQVVSGRYKSVYDRKTKLRTLVPTTPAEFAAELAKTTARVPQKEKIGSLFPDFQAPDLSGQPISAAQLRGKVAVINFWFVGCTPCEMERPDLNALRKRYLANDQVAFLSFAASPAPQLRAFLAQNPFSFDVIASDRPALVEQFGVKSFPVTVVLDRQGRYVFNGQGSGVGISHLLRQYIDHALAQP